MPVWKTKLWYYMISAQDSSKEAETRLKSNNKTSHVKYENSGELSKQTIDKIVNF